MRIRETLALVGVLATVGLTTMCSGMSTKEVALAGATTEARASAERDRHGLEKTLRLSPETDGEASRVKTVDRLGPDKVFDSRVVPDGYEVDGVYYGRGDAGGGWDAEQASVRMCVRFTVRPSESATVKLGDVDCPATLPTTVPGYGTVTRTVKLAD